MALAKCEGCGESVKLEHLSQEDTENATWLCLVCAYPEYYKYDEGSCRYEPA